MIKKLFAAQVSIYVDYVVLKKILRVGDEFEVEIPFDPLPDSVVRLTIRKEKIEYQYSDFQKLIDEQKIKEVEGKLAA